MPPKPGHELHKQIVELAFMRYKFNIRIILKEIFKTAIMFPGRVKLLSPGFVYSYLWPIWYE